MKRFNRHETSWTIATLWEFHTLEKINMNPKYQRNSEVWTKEKQSFLIDSIIKNFPMPPVFLHEFIDQKTGKTKYDVIDGKQRLTSIFHFINGDIALPEDCSEDGYCSSIVDGSTFQDWDKKEFAEVKKNFWQYSLGVVFIDVDEEEETINDVFDRLNRNGEPLTAQEFRKAQYVSTPLYKVLEKLPLEKPMDKLLFRLDSNRYEDVEFCSELLFSLVENKAVDSNKKSLDGLYKKYCDKNTLNEEEIEFYYKSYKAACNTLNELLSGFDMYYKNSVSHLYALWLLAWQINKQQVDPREIREKVILFYKKVKQKEDDPYVVAYNQSTSQRTKSQASRQKRVDSLLGYLGLGILHQ